MQVIAHLFDNWDDAQKAFAKDTSAGKRLYAAMEIRGAVGVVKYSVATTMAEAQRLAGVELAKVHWHFTPTADVLTYVKGRLRG